MLINVIINLIGSKIKLQERFESEPTFSRSAVEKVPLEAEFYTQFFDDETNSLDRNSNSFSRQAVESLPFTAYEEVGLYVSNA